MSHKENRVRSVGPKRAEGGLCVFLFVQFFVHKRDHGDKVFWGYCILLRSVVAVRQVFHQVATEKSPNGLSGLCTVTQQSKKKETLFVPGMDVPVYSACFLRNAQRSRQRVVPRAAMGPSGTKDHWISCSSS